MCETTAWCIRLMMNYYRWTPTLYRLPTPYHIYLDSVQFTKKTPYKIQPEPASALDAAKLTFAGPVVCALHSCSSVKMAFPTTSIISCGQFPADVISALSDQGDSTSVGGISWSWSHMPYAHMCTRQFATATRARGNTEINSHPPPEISTEPTLAPPPALLRFLMQECPVTIHAYSMINDRHTLPIPIINSEWPSNTRPRYPHSLSSTRLDQQHLGVAAATL